MTEKEKIELGVQKFLNLEGKVIEIAKELLIDSKLITERLNELGYKLRGGATAKQVIAIKNAVDDYISHIEENINVGYFAKKHGCAGATLSKRLKELGYEIINYQTSVKIDQNVFDTIDTEEKAYWLGFLYADGYVSASDNKFELSLLDSDSEHLEKFNKFMKCTTPDKVKHGSVKLGDKVYKRCRWNVSNAHLKESLIKLGCVPNKSLILTFPDDNIFTSNKLIRHFIRGYVDGDRSLSWSNKDHTYPCLEVVGTENFLLGIMNHLGLKNYKLQYKKSTSENPAKLFSLGHKIAFKVAFYLYYNANIYLERKYKQFKEYCRLYEELYRELETNIGEDCDVNPEINSEIKASESSYSVGIEPSVEE